MDAILLHTADVIRLSDDDLLRLCLANRDLQIERDTDGNLILMPPSGSSASRSSAELVWRLGNWKRASGGGVVFDSNGGFVLPDGSMRAADAAWMPLEVWERFTPEARGKFLTVCPDFVVELRSPRDRIDTVRKKMRAWMANGCRLGWLVDPLDMQAFVYRADGDETHVVGEDVVLSGEDVVPGFTLPLAALR